MTLAKYNLNASETRFYGTTISGSLWNSSRHRDVVEAFWIRPTNCGDIDIFVSVSMTYRGVSDDHRERRNLEVTAMINRDSSVNGLRFAMNRQDLVLQGDEVHLGSRTSRGL
jgi:hypothetical protein